MSFCVALESRTTLGSRVWYSGPVRRCRTCRASALRYRARAFSRRHARGRIVDAQQASNPRRTRLAAGMLNWRCDLRRSICASSAVRDASALCRRPACRALRSELPGCHRLQAPESGFAQALHRILDQKRRCQATSSRPAATTSCAGQSTSRSGIRAFRIQLPSRHHRRECFSTARTQESGPPYPLLSFGAGPEIAAPDVNEAAKSRRK